MTTATLVARATAHLATIDRELGEDMVFQLFPEEAYVTHSSVIDWAHDLDLDDAVAAWLRERQVVDPPDDYMEELYARLREVVPRRDILDAIHFLQDVGAATFGELSHGVASVNRLSNTALRDVARRCWPKEQHASEGAALAQKRSILARGLAKDETTIRAYECAHCIHPETGRPSWHVGHYRGGDHATVPGTQNDGRL